MKNLRRPITLATSHSRREINLASPILVILPIFNGTSYVKNLLDGLDASIPPHQKNLRFLLIDDASTESSLGALLKSHPFCRRSSTTVTRNPRNLGFVRTVNRGLNRRREKEDVLLLNSDIQIRSSSIEILHRVSKRSLGIASVTPLTNNGSIASLFGWPAGSEIPLGLSVDEVTDEVERLNQRTPLIPAPTGVGFCMYMTACALEKVGPFDAAAFGRGYGEECDWSQRAIQQGMINVVCTETFVYHAGTKSFSTKEKQSRVALAQAKLEEFHPSYSGEVQHYIDRNPLQPNKIPLLLSLASRSRAKSGRALVTFVLHRSPEFQTGGTEAHVRNFSELLLRKENTDVVQVFPSDDRSQWTVRYLVAGSELEYFRISSTREVLSAFLNEVLLETSVLHVHHWMGLPPSARHVLQAASCPDKFVTLHDYFAVCSSYNLVDASRQYCGVPKSEQACNSCLEALFSNASGLNIGRFRREQIEFLDGFHKILTPSEEARKVVRRSLQVQRLNHKDDDELCRNVERKIQVFPNSLLFQGAFLSVRDFKKRKSHGSERPFKIVFLGALSEVKGSNLIAEAQSELAELGYPAEVWGKINLPAAVVRLPIYGFEGQRQLRDMAKSGDRLIVCVPSIWPETFSYVCYEALFVIGAPVVVGPFGHPRSVVETMGVGAAMETASTASLIKAIKSCIRNYAVHERKLQRLIEDFRPERVEPDLQKSFRSLLSRGRFSPAPMLQQGRSDLTVESWLTKVSALEQRVAYLEKQVRANGMLVSFLRHPEQIVEAARGDLTAASRKGQGDARLVERERNSREAFLRRLERIQNGDRGAGM